MFDVYHSITIDSKSYFSFTQEKSKSPHDQENIELSTMPSTSQEHDQTAGNLNSQSIDNGNQEDEDFTTQQLYSFAWQIAGVMVNMITPHKTTVILHF